MLDANELRPGVVDCPEQLIELRLYRRAVAILAVLNEEDHQEGEVIAGHSAGAYNGRMLAYDPRWLGSGRRRIRGFIGLSGPYDFLPFDGPITREAFKGTADLASTQPVNFVARGDAPAFLATGDEDTFVQPANSDALAARLRAVGTRVVRRSYPGIGHVGTLTAIARPLRNRAAVLDDMSLFAQSVTQ